MSSGPDNETLKAWAIEDYHNPPEVILIELEKIRLKRKEKQEYNRKYYQMKKEAKQKATASGIEAAQRVADQIEHRT